jgi:transcription initiation factor TFIIH subunit 1
VADEYAKISGSASKGMASGIKSNLDLGLASGGAGASKKEKKKEESNDDSVTVKPLPRSGVIHLGVEEMRQIFLMYPAVHKAYEEKVPLELSEEQFWRKYLESEYFHRDRGRVGGHIGRVNELEKMEMEKMVGKKTVEKKDEKKEDKKDEKENASERMAGDEARLAAAAGSDDIFSRYDQKGPQSLPRTTNLAVGQFDLASTAETERGERYLEGGDLHPDYSEIDSRGARVIDKYNRHWAIVLHPNECSAKGKIFNEALVNDDVVGNVDEGVDREMSELVGFANAGENQADHSRGIGEDDGDCLELHLNDVSGYRGKFLGGKAGTDAASSAAANNSEMTMKYTKYLAATLQATTEALLRDQNTGKVKGFADAATLKQAFPEPKIGRGLLEALSKKMAADSQTEADVQKLADSLPEEFRNNLATYFRRSSELLRHFFGLRSVFNDDSDDNGGIGVSESQRNRLTSIVKGMEKVHGEMYELTRNLPLVESKMFKPIMDNLDWAFKLHREDSSKGGKGGFVPVARGFVSV